MISLIFWTAQPVFLDVNKTGVKTLPKVDMIDETSGGQGLSDINL